MGAMPKIQWDSNPHCPVGYENHKPYLRTEYQNPYQKCFGKLEFKYRTQRWNNWCHNKTKCMINICLKIEFQNFIFLKKMTFFKISRGRKTTNDYSIVFLTFFIMTLI